MVEIAVPEVDYTQYSNRQLVAVPLALLAVAVLVIVGWYVITGAPANLGLEFTGGTELRIDVQGENPRQQIDEAFSASPESVQQVDVDGSALSLEPDRPGFEKQLGRLELRAGDVPAM
jgi:preprotein translocase subunit SecF